MLGHRSLNVEDYLTILKRRWWIVAIPAVLFGIAGVGFTFFVTPRYTSQTLVIINQQKVPEDIVRPVIAEDLNSRLASMREEIMSRARLEPIIKKYNLYDSMRMDMDARLAAARGNIEIIPIQSGIPSNGLPGFKIQFTASDPQTAQQVCGEITAMFTDANIKIRDAAARDTTNFLKERVDQEKAKLDEQDAKLATFKRQYVGMLPEDTGNNTSIVSSLSSRLDAINGQLTSLQQNRQLNQSILESQLQALSAPGGSVNRAPGAAEAELVRLQSQESELSETYRDDYPALRHVRARIAELQKQIAQENSAPAPGAAAAPSSAPRIEPTSIKTLRTEIAMTDASIAAKRREQDQVAAQIRQYEGKIQSSPQVEEQEKELTRDYQTTLDAYNSLKTKLDQSDMATDLEQRQQGETFTLLDAANLPEQPTYPKRSVFGGGGLMAGLALGLAIVALLEYRDTALRSERDVWAFTELPTLAVIAWAGERSVSTAKPSLLRRLFGRTAKNELADAAG